MTILHNIMGSSHCRVFVEENKEVYRARCLYPNYRESSHAQCAGMLLASPQRAQNNASCA